MYVLPELSKEDDFDLEIQLDLHGSDAERQQAINRLFERYKAQLMGFVRNRLPSLSSEDVASAVHDAFVELNNKACDGSLDIEKPVKPLLFTIARRRGIDRVRHNTSREIPDDEKIAVGIAQALHGTDMGHSWKTFCDKQLANQISDEFRDFVATLPAKQKLVAQVLVDFLPHMLSDTEISDEIFKRSGKKVPVMEIKGAKQAAINKFRKILNDSLMSTELEEKAVLALITGALHPFCADEEVTQEEVDAFVAKGFCLSAEDEAALSALGSSPLGKVARTISPGRTLSGVLEECAMNRELDTAEMDEELQKILDKKRQEIIEKIRKRKDGTS